MTTATRSAFDELEAVRDRVAALQRAPHEIEAERQAALAAVETARTELRELYAAAAGEEPDAKREQQLSDAIDEAERAATARWEERLEGARLAAKDARGDEEAFIREHFEALAAERLKDARDAAEGLNGALGRLREWLEYYGSVSSSWVPLLQAMPGMDVRDLPFPGFELVEFEQLIEQRFPAGSPVPPPAPRSLVGLLDDQPRAGEAAS